MDAAHPTDRRPARVKPLHILFWLALVAPLFAFWPSFQDPATDWAKEVERACTASRYGLRLAAGRKVAAAGGAAVPAIRDYERDRGRTAVQAMLVDAIADATVADAAVIALLTEWASDTDFYWRGQAMRGLANRVATAPDHADALRKLFGERRDDPAWLTRVHARFGLALLGDEQVLQLPEPDPRALPRLTWLLLGEGKMPPLQPLLDALGDERSFLGDPWGKRLGQDAHRALRTWLGDDHPAPAGEAFADKQAALEQLTAAAARKSGQELRTPQVVGDPATEFTGGVEVLSCKLGDRFVRWTADGQLHFGLDAAQTVRIDADTWRELSTKRTQLQLDELHGVVVCDSMRIQWQEPAVHSKIAPEALPAAVSEWLHDLAAAVDRNGASPLAASLRTSLAQFSSR